MAAGVIQGKPWCENGECCIAVMVDDGGKRGRTQYIGRSPLVDAKGRSLTAAKLQAACLADITKQRTPAAQPTLPTITGTVQV